MEQEKTEIETVTRKQRPLPDRKFETHVTTIRGLETSWLQAGKTSDQTNDPILLFLHGFPDHANAWELQLSEFSKHHLCIAPHLRGVGSSPIHGRLGTYKSRASRESITLDLLAILKIVDPSQSRPIVVIAHDIGGIFGENLARHLGERLIGAIYINSVTLAQMASKLSHLSQLKKSWYIGLFNIPYLSEYSIRRQQEKMVRHERRLANVDDIDLGNAKDPQLVNGLLWYRYGFGELLHRRFWKQAKEKPFHCPVIFLWGKDDKYLDIPTEDELSRLSDRIEIRVLRGSHWIFQEHPDRIHDLMYKFLKDVSK